MPPEFSADVSERRWRLTYDTPDGYIGGTERRRAMRQIVAPHDGGERDNTDQREHDASN